MAGLEVGLGVDAVLGSFLVHCEDAHFPFGIGAGNAESDIHDGSGVVLWDSFSYGLH